MGLMAQFTRTAIVNSFIRLLNEKPLDKITVKDIVDDCGVNRNTFYYHFQDIYAYSVLETLSILQICMNIKCLIVLCTK